jgi:tRNA(fMet)-specific endonuclease VapC
LTRYLLDTNIVSDLVVNPQGRAAKRLRKVGETKVCTSIVVASELRYGAAKRGSARLNHQLHLVLGALEIVALDAPADEIYGTIRAKLEKAGKPIGGNDLLMAAHAIALNCVLVSDNEREFSRVAGLTRENWLR